MTRDDTQNNHHSKNNRKPKKNKQPSLTKLRNAWKKADTPKRILIVGETLIAKYRRARVDRWIGAIRRLACASG